MLTRWSVDHPVASAMLIIGILVLGIISLFRIGVELMPSVDFPVAAVITPYPGATSSEVEEQVTKVVEEAVGSLEGIENIISTSSDGSSIVIVQFDYDKDVNDATNQIRAKIDQIENSLPGEAMSPTVSGFDPTAMPVMTLSIHGEQTLEELSRLTEKEIIPELQKVNGVASVSIQGDTHKQINVEIDHAIMKDKGVTSDQVISAIRSQDVAMPLGQITTGDKNISVRLSSELGNIDNISNLIVRPRTTVEVMPSADDIERQMRASFQRMSQRITQQMAAQMSQQQPGQPAAAPSFQMPRMTMPTVKAEEKVLEEVRIKDVAEVKEVLVDPNVIGRFNQEPAVNLEIIRRSDANTVETVNGIKKTLEKTSGELPKDVEISEIVNEAEEVEDSIGSTINNTYMAALIAALVLFLFLRSLRSTLIIALSIPTSVVATFGLIYFAGYTLNVITLGGLALGIGLLVDNSIVVLESIFRMLEEGINPKEAAKLGTHEVGGAITASTLTSIAVFLPIVFVGGFAKEMLGPLAITVIFALSMSLLVALTVVPTLSSALYMFRYQKGKRREKVAHRIREPYKIVLNWCLNHRAITIALTLSVFVASLFLATKIGAELMPPESGRPMISVSITMPPGSSQEAANKVVTKVENEVSDLSGIQSVSVSVRGGGQGSGGSVMQGGSNAQAELKIRLASDKNTKKSVDSLIRTIEKKTAGIEGLEKIEVEAGESQVHGGMGSAITVEFYGPSLSKLEELSKDAEERIKKIDGVLTAESSLDRKKPQYDVKVDQQKAVEAGISPYQVASTVRTALYGQDVATFATESGKNEDIRVYISGSNGSVESLKQLAVMDSTGDYREIGEVAEIEEGITPISIDHIDEKRSVSIDVKIDEEKANLSDVASEIQTKVDKIDLPKGYNVYYGGEYEQMIDIFTQLVTALLLAIGLVYMIMAAQFGSLKYPFIIMFTIPLAAIGVLVALFITKTALSITAFFGIIMLVGIVVNNAIVLIDYINTLRERGLSIREALLNGGQERLRPVLMTMATTVLAMTPIAIGFGGGKMMGPMAISVMGGLSFSTFLTLAFIPVLYSLFTGERRETKALAESAKAE